MKVPEFLEELIQVKSLDNLPPVQELEFLYLENGIVTDFPKGNDSCVYYIFLTSLLKELKNSRTYIPLDEIDFIHLHRLRWKDVCLIRFNSGNFTIVYFTGCGCSNCLSIGFIPPEQLEFSNFSTSTVDKINYSLTSGELKFFLLHYNQSISTYESENHVQFIE